MLMLTTLERYVRSLFGRLDIIHTFGSIKSNEGNYWRALVRIKRIDGCHESRWMQIPPKQPLNEQRLESQQLGKSTCKL